MASFTANDVNIPDEESGSHTNFKIAKFSHTWTISNFSFIEKKTGDRLTSVTFPLKGDEDNQMNTIKWCLDLYPRGESEDYKEVLSLYLCLLAAKNSETNTIFNMGVINAKGKRHTLHPSTEIHKFEVNDSFGFQTFIERKYLLKAANGLMKDDKLVLFCDIKVLMDISNTSEKLNKIQFTEPKHHVLANIGHLLETKKFSDVIFTACGKEFQAHKAILAAQSPVFSAMFEHDMEEKKQSRVDIIDMDDQVLQGMLLFLYSGEVKNIKKIATGLLAAADKYALEKLKIMCEEALRASLTIENAADTLILADLHRADHLKPRVISFICFHAADVVTTEGFKLMLLSHPSLIAEAFCQMVIRKNDNLHEVPETDAAASKLNASVPKTL